MHANRPHYGQQMVAGRLRALLDSSIHHSEIRGKYPGIQECALSRLHLSTNNLGFILRKNLIPPLTSSSKSQELPQGPGSVHPPLHPSGPRRRQRHPHVCQGNPHHGDELCPRQPGMANARFTSSTDTMRVACHVYLHSISVAWCMKATSEYCCKTVCKRCAAFVGRWCLLIEMS